MDRRPWNYWRRLRGLGARQRAEEARRRERCRDGFCPRSDGDDAQSVGVRGSPPSWAGCLALCEAAGALAFTVDRVSMRCVRRPRKAPAVWAKRRRSGARLSLVSDFISAHRQSVPIRVLDKRRSHWPATPLTSKPHDGRRQRASSGRRWSRSFGQSHSLSISVLTLRALQTSHRTILTARTEDSGPAISPRSASSA